LRKVAGRACPAPTTEERRSGGSVRQALQANATSKLRNGIGIRGMRRRCPISVTRRCTTSCGAVSSTGVASERQVRNYRTELGSRDATTMPDFGDEAVHNVDVGGSVRQALQANARSEITERNWVPGMRRRCPISVMRRCTTSCRAVSSTGVASERQVKITERNWDPGDDEDARGVSSTGVASQVKNTERNWVLGRRRRCPTR
jgi:hypothetical protein